MKKVISYILIGAYLAAVFQFTVPYLSYVANYTYFSTEVCINKHNPDIECNGQCQLKKMVKQHAPDDTAPDNALQIEKRSSSSIFFCDTVFKAPVLLSEKSFRPLAKKETLTELFNSPSTPPPQLG